MKKTSLILFLSIFGLAVHGQNFCDLIEKASLSFCEEDYFTSQKHLERLIAEYPEHHLNEELKFELGKVLYHKGELNESRKVLLDILHQLPDTTNEDYELINCPTTYNTDSSTYCSRITHPQDNKNLKHQSLLYLSTIAVKQKDFESSLEYLELAENKYPKKASCLDAYYKRNGYIAFKKAESLLLLNDTLGALKALIPEISNFYSYLGQIRELTNSCSKALYNEKEIEILIDSTVNSLYVKRVESSNGNFANFLYYKMFGEDHFYHTNPAGIRKIEHVPEEVLEEKKKELKEILVKSLKK